LVGTEAVVEDVVVLSVVVTGVLLDEDIRLDVVVGASELETVTQLKS